MADVLGRRYLQLQNRVRRNGRERWTFLRGTDGSNPTPSTGESKANRFPGSWPTRTRRSSRARRRSPASADCCASTEKRAKLYGLIATKGGSDDQGAAPQCLSLP